MTHFRLLLSVSCLLICAGLLAGPRLAQAQDVAETDVGAASTPAPAPAQLAPAQLAPDQEGPTPDAPTLDPAADPGALSTEPAAHSEAAPPPQPFSPVPETQTEPSAPASPAAPPAAVTAAAAAPVEPVEETTGPVTPAIAEQSAAFRFPVRAIDRFLVLRGGVMRLAAVGMYTHRRVFVDGVSASPEQAIMLAPELEYGVWDDLTIGGVLFPVTFWPEDQLGNPSAHLRYRIQIDDTAIALVGRVHFPFADDSEWRVDAEVPVQFRLAPNWQLQTGGAASFTIADPLGITLAVPVELLWQLARDTYVRVATGASLTDFESDTLRIPVEFSTAYTFASALGPVAELSVFVRWPEMFAPAGQERAVRVGNVEAGLGFSAYFYQ